MTYLLVIVRLDEFLHLYTSLNEIEMGGVTGMA